jgi:hypothetical protein
MVIEGDTDYSTSCRRRRCITRRYGSFALRFATALYQSQLFEIDPAAQSASTCLVGANIDNNGQWRQRLPESAVQRQMQRHRPWWQRTSRLPTAFNLVVLSVLLQTRTLAAWLVP